MGDSDLPLTAKRLAFCRFFIGDAKRNATRAAIMAGFAKGSADVTATRLMADPRIKAEIKRLEGIAMREHQQVALLIDATQAGADPNNQHRSPEQEELARRIRAETDADVVSGLSRAYILAGLKENFEVTLGRRKRPVSRIEDVKTITDDATGKTATAKRVIELSVYDPNPAAANAAAALLLAQPEISNKGGPDGEADQREIEKIEAAEWIDFIQNAPTRRHD